MGERGQDGLPVAGRPARTPEAQAEGRQPLNPARLTLPQQIVANTLAWFCVDLSPEGRRAAMMIEVLREALPRARPAHGHIGRVVAAAEAAVAAWPLRADRTDPYSWNRAMMEADIAVAAFLFWRAALAREAMMPSPPIPEDTATATTAMGAPS